MSSTTIENFGNETIVLQTNNNTALFFSGDKLEQVQEQDPEQAPEQVPEQVPTLSALAESVAAAEKEVEVCASYSLELQEKAIWEEKAAEDGEGTMAEEGKAALEKEAEESEKAFQSAVEQTRIARARLAAETRAVAEAKSKAEVAATNIASATPQEFAAARAAANIAFQRGGGGGRAGGEATKNTFACMGLLCTKSVATHLRLENTFESNLVSDIAKADYLAGNQGR